MTKPIILLSGGTGVGTSTFSFELAKASGITNIMSTDFIREVIRSIIAPKINPTLEGSTYTGGKTINYDKKPEDVQKTEIIRAYKTQCAAVTVGIEGVIKRAVTENIPLIVEGVHLIPGKLRDSALFQECQERLVEYLVYIRDPEIHRERFEQRQRDAPERSLEKYLDNFREIRWIHDYMLARSHRYDEIALIDNGRDLQTSVKEMLKNPQLQGFKDQ